MHPDYLFGGTGPPQFSTIIPRSFAGSFIDWEVVIALVLQSYS
jgi:hypothetical protein